MATALLTNGTARVKPGRRTSLRHVVDLQDIIHGAALGLKVDFHASCDREERARVANAMSNLGKSWCSLQDTKREIQGKPKAGIRKPEQQSRSHHRPCFEMPTETADG
jgi:hypothetical protein